MLEDRAELIRYLRIAIPGGWLVAGLYTVLAIRFWRSRHHGESSYPDHRPAMLAFLPWLSGPAFLFCVCVAIDVAVDIVRASDWQRVGSLAPLLICSTMIGALGFVRLLLAAWHTRFAWLRNLMSRRLSGLDGDVVLAEALDVAFIGQYSFYAVVVTVIWISRTDTSPSLLLTLAQVVLLFVIDDWNIIAAYVGAIGGRILPLDLIRIIGTTLLIAGLTVASVGRQFGAAGVVPVLLAMVLSLFFACAFWYGHMSKFPRHARAARPGAAGQPYQ